MVFYKNFPINIRVILLILFCFISFYSFGQRIEDQIKSVNSIDEANYFIENNSNIDAQIFAVVPKIETEEISKIFQNRKKGDIFSVNGNIYKVVDSRKTLALRVSYIFLDGNKMPYKSIDTLRMKILDQYKSGAKFSELANKYTMDSAVDGDLNWFTEGTMVKDFETAIKSHGKNDIFTIDLKKEKWYYVALKTYEDQIVEELSILKIQG